MTTTGANLLVVSAAAYSGGGPCTMTDSNNNAWTQINSAAYAGQQNAYLYYSSAPVVGASQVFTWGGANCYPSLAVSAYSGAASGNPLDQNSSHANSVTGTTVQPGSVTPSQGNELVVAGQTEDVANGSAGQWANPTIDSGFTVSVSTPGQSDSFVAYGAASAYLIQTSATAENPTWTTDSSVGSATLTGSIATFKGAASGSPAPTTTVPLLGM